MKTIYFVQHGIAHSKDLDANRALSDIGNDQVYKVATYLKRHEIAVRKICHSGKLRAQQTAVIFSEMLGVSDLQKIAGMEPNDSPLDLIKQISEDFVMYIGHLPHLAKVVTEIAAGGVDSNVIKFQNASVVCIEMDESGATIKWFITPDMC